VVLFRRRLRGKKKKIAQTYRNIIRCRGRKKDSQRSPRTPKDKKKGDVIFEYTPRRVKKEVCQQRSLRRGGGEQIGRAKTPGPERGGSDEKKEISFSITKRKKIIEPREKKKDITTAGQKKKKKGQKFL